MSDIFFKNKETIKGEYFEISIKNFKNSIFSSFPKLKTKLFTISICVFMFLFSLLFSFEIIWEEKNFILVSVFEFNKRMEKHSSLFSSKFTKKREHNEKIF